MNRNIRQIVRGSWILQITAMWVMAALLLLAWPDLLRNLMKTAGYEEHGHCYLWQPKLVSLHVVSDASIALSYLIISCALATLVYRARASIPFRWLFLAFGLFIIACGATHFMEVVTVYTPLYWLSGYLKLITAAASIVTACALPPMLRPILNLLEDAKTSALNKTQLQDANRVLENEIAERKRAQDELQILQERFQGIYEASKDAIAFSEPDGQLIDVNRAFLQLVGYTKDEVLKLHYQEMTPPEHHAREAEIVKAVKESGVTAEYEKEYFRKDGTRVPIELSVFVVRNPQKQIIGMAAFVRDITQRREMARIKDRQNEELNRSNRDLEQFASVASHDLQEPLRKIQMFGARLKQKSGDSLNDDGKISLEKMLDAARRMETLINDLLALSRVTTKTRPFSKVQLSQLVSGVLSDLEARIVESGAHVEVGDLPTIPADSSQMRQLFQNLVGNALKFGRPDVAPVIQISASTRSQQTTIQIKDNGIGFEPEYAERIFEPFQRLHSRTSYAGTGIGLSICRKIVERHGGTIRAQSAPGEGTTFIITLPLSSPDGISLT